MKTLFTSIFIGLLFVGYAFAQSVSERELKVLEGATWTGELTYLDYRSNTKTSIKSNVTISPKPDSANMWTFAYVYPDEPKANSSSDVSLSSDGKIFNGQKVVETKKLTDGTTTIVTAKEGDDNGKKALFRYTYTFDAKKFTILKEVQYMGETAWFERNTYSWAR